MILSQIKAPGTVVASGWTTPDNVKVDDSTNAVISIPSLTQSTVMTASNYGFSIPDNATIVGIKGIIQAYRTVDTSPALILNNIALNNRSGYPTPNITDTALSVSATNRVQGGPTDLWNRVDWTPAIINASTFALRFGGDNQYTGGSPASISLAVDYVEMTVWYSVPDSNLFFGSNF